MSGFPFLPRSVKRRKIESPPKQDQVSPSLPSISTPTGPPTKTEGQASENLNMELPTKGKGKAMNIQSATTEDAAHKGYDLEDLARVVWLSMSDYGLWSDADLRRKIYFSSQNEVDCEDDVADSTHDDGYIPLSYLMKKSHAFLQAASTPSLAGLPEIAYVKAIRTHVSDLMEVRLILTNEGPSSFGPNRWSSKKLPTGYEVKRKPTKNRFQGYGKTDWDDLTIYVENIPFVYRNICGVSKFVSFLLKSSEHSVSKVQHVAFPPHHNDRPGTLPSCKGFALVTLSTAEDVQFLLDQWPWDEPLITDEHNRKSDVSQESDVFQQEAKKFGHRCLSKRKWEELRAEYLLYRQQLIAELEADNEAQEKVHRTQTTLTHEKHINSPLHVHEPGHDQPEPPQAKSISDIPPQSKSQGPIFNASSPFPPECLVLVRHVHSETNKTTLRALFSQASKLVEGKKDASDGLDYVDYTKGLDSCYLRFSSPPHAAFFVKYFSDHTVTQSFALDGEGKQIAETNTTGSATPIITPELVTGKREELYWQKVPEKVRRQAVEKALNVARCSAGKDDHIAGSSSNEIQGKKRRRGK